MLPSHYTKNNDIMMEFINTKYIYCYKFATYCYIFVTCSIAYPCMQVLVAVLAGSKIYAPCSGIPSKSTMVKIGNKFDVSGYPTLKYLRYGKKAQDYDGGRKKKDLVDFMVKNMRMHRNEL